MSSFPMSLGASVLAISTLLSSCSEPKQLSDYSTEEIVTEYHARLDHIMRGPMTELSENTNLALQINPNTSDDSTARKNHELHEQVIEMLTPFAHQGETVAEWYIGSNLLATSVPESQAHQNGFIMIRSAAQKGLTEAAVSLSGYYLFCAMEVERESREPWLGAAYLWAKEASKADPVFIGLVDPILDQLATDDSAEFEATWMNRSHKNDANSPFCDNQADRK